MNNLIKIMFCTTPIFFLAVTEVGSLYGQSFNSSPGIFPRPCRSISDIQVDQFKDQQILLEKSPINDRLRPRLIFQKDWNDGIYWFTSTAEIHTPRDWILYWKKYFKEVPPLTIDLKTKMVLLHPAFPHRNLDSVDLAFDQICDDGKSIKVFDHFVAPKSSLILPFYVETPSYSYLPYQLCTVYAYILPRSDKPVEWITSQPPDFRPIRNSAVTQEQ